MCCRGRNTFSYTAATVVAISWDESSRVEIGTPSRTAQHPPREKERHDTNSSTCLHTDQMLLDASSYYPNSCFILIYTAKCGNRTHLTQVFFAIVFLSFLAPALALSCVSWLSSLSGPCFLLKVLCFSLMLLLVRLVSSVALLSSAGNGWFGAARCLRPRGGRQSRGASVFAALLLC